MQVLKKEINAAYAEQTAACKKGASAHRAACMQQARATYDRDNANARELVADAPTSTVTERIVSTTPATGQDGSRAYGNSGMNGQTGAGMDKQPATQSDAMPTETKQSMSAGNGATP